MGDAHAFFVFHVNPLPPPPYISKIRHLCGFARGRSLKFLNRENLDSDYQLCTGRTFWNEN